MIPEDLKYSEEHEWVRLEGDVATIGVTHYAQEQLTDIVFVELPQVGRAVKAGDATAVLESVKSVSDVYSPLAGEIVEVNTELEKHPEYINESPYERGWIFKLKTRMPDLSALLTSAAYQAFVEKQGH